LLSAILAVLFTWAGLTAAYYIPYPAGFFITSFAFGAYLLARLTSYGIGQKMGRTAAAKIA
jgi:zinc/manganese transport system permease protein